MGRVCSRALISASSCEGIVGSPGLLGMLGEGSRRASIPANELGTKFCEATIEGESEEEGLWLPAPPQQMPLE